MSAGKEAPPLPAPKAFSLASFFSKMAEESLFFLIVAHACTHVKDLHFCSVLLIKLIQFATARQEQRHASALSRVYSQPCDWPFFHFGGVGGVGGSYVGERTFHLPHLHYWFIKGLGIILEVVPTCAVPEKRREV